MKKTLSRRSFVGLAATASVAAGLTLSGCGTNGGDSSTTSTTLIVGANAGYDSVYGTLDPVHEDGSVIWLMRLAFEGLVQTVADANGALVTAPCLADSWEISSDGLTYTFHLHPGVKFFDGTPVTGEDWIWSLTRARDTEESSWASYAAPIQDVTAPDDSTLVIKLNAASSSFITMLAIFNMSVQSKKAYDALGEEAYLKQPVGTGPFSFGDWSLHEYIEMNKNPNYWGPAYAIDKLRINIIADDNTRMLQLQAGELDICLSIPATRVEEMRNNPDLTVISTPLTEQRYIVMNNLTPGVPAFANKQVRQALRLGTDRDEVVQIVLQNEGKPTWNVFPNVTPFFNSTIPDPGYDAVKAKQMLAEAGYPNGFSTDFCYNSGDATQQGIATLIKAQWAKIGVTVNPVGLERAALSSLFDSMSHQIVSLRWSDDTNDPQGLFDFIAVYDQSNGFYTGFKNSEFTQIADRTRTSTDDAKRKTDYDRAQQILFDESPLFPLFQIVYSIATKANITGLKQNTLGMYDFSQVKVN